jgi:hypothetical protein
MERDSSVDRSNAGAFRPLDHRGCASAPENTLWLMAGQSRVSNCAYDSQVPTDAVMRARMQDPPPPIYDVLGTSAHRHET